jgi:hypothetical protein
MIFRVLNLEPAQDLRIAQSATSARVLRDRSAREACHIRLLAAMCKSIKGGNKHHENKTHI